MKEEINITSPEAVLGRVRGPVVTTTTKSVKLKIDFQCWPGKKIRASDLATLIANESSRLESLVLDGVRVVGDFVVVSDALASCIHLKSFDIFSCQLSNPSKPLQRLAMNLSQLSRLVHICLSFSSTQQQTPWAILTPVLQNPNHTLRILFLNGFEAPSVEDTKGNEQVGEFLAACGASKTLQNFTCLPLSNSAFTNSVIRDIEDLIRRTSSLEELKICLAKETTVEGLAKALRCNQSIRKLDIQGHHRPTAKAALDCFYETLEEHNFTLQELQMKILKDGTTDGIDFHLYLNRMGRARLLLASEASTIDWIETIARQEDVSAVYFFLKVNPSLFWTDP